MTIKTYYGDWRLYNDLVVEALRGMSTEELALRAAPDDVVSADLRYVHSPIQPDE